MSKLSTMVGPGSAKYVGLLVGCILLIGVSAYSAVTERLALGTIPRYDPYGGPASVFFRRFTIAPGEVLGWHYHPGVGGYTVVNKGTLVKEDGCGGFEVFSPNDAFVEHPNRVHRGGNLGSEPIETIQAFVVPLQSDGGRNSGWLPPGTAVATTVNVPGRLCGPPAEVQECQQGGWIKFDHPRRFASQADCEQFIGTGK